MPCLDALPFLCPTRAIEDLISAMSPELNGPLFIYQSSGGSKLLLYKDVRTVIRKWASSQGIKLGKYGSHSARIGSASTAYKAGVHSAGIKLLGDWLSSTFLSYIRQDVKDIQSIQMDMVDQLKTQLRML